MMSNKYFVQVFNLSPVPSLILLADVPFTIVEVNDAYLRTNNVTRDKIAGKGIFEIPPYNEANEDSANLATLNSSLNTVIATGSHHKPPLLKFNRQENNDPKTAARWLQIENMPLADDEAKPQYIVHFAADVTDAILHGIKISTVAD